MEVNEAYFYDFENLQAIYEFDNRHAKYIKQFGIFRQGLCFLHFLCFYFYFYYNKKKKFYYYSTVTYIIRTMCRNPYCLLLTDGAPFTYGVLAHNSLLGPTTFCYSVHLSTSKLSICCLLNLVIYTVYLSLVQILCFFFNS
jgi:hypothetical protein